MPFSGKITRRHLAPCQFCFGLARVPPATSTVGNLGGRYHVAAEVLGETGWASTDHKADSSNKHPPVDSDPKGGPPSFERFSEAYRREAEAWVNGIRIRKMPGPNTWDGYLANKAAAACLESARIEKPVTLDPTPSPVLYQDAG